MRRLELDAPNLGDAEVAAVSSAVRSGFVSTFGPLVSQFEQRLAGFLQAPAVVSTQSGTAALHVALHELGIGPGDEVIVPSLTFVATITPVLFAGATPVIVDVDEETWTMDVDCVTRAISPRTRAIVPVHLYGNPCRMDVLLDLAARHRIAVVEDATESLGATYAGRATGTLGDLGCFSFNGNKLITTGGGGAVATGLPARAAHMKYLVNQARGGDLPDHAEVGFNYRMTNLEAALGLAQLERIRRFLNAKQTFRSVYERALAGHPTLKLQTVTPQAQSAHWLNAATVKQDAARLREQLRACGVPTRPLFTPLHTLPPYRSFRFEGTGVAERLHAHGLCLPSSTLNSADDVAWAADELKRMAT
jgi:perosamine synthetase